MKRYFAPVFCSVSLLAGWGVTKANAQTDNPQIHVAAAKAAAYEPGQDFTNIFDLCAACRQKGVNSGNRLMRVNNLKPVFFDNAAKPGNNREINRQTPVQTKKLHARSFEIFFERTAAGRRKSHIQSVFCRVPANVEFEHFRAAAI